MAGNVNLPLGQPVAPPVQVNRNPTPVSDPSMAGPSAQMAGRTDTAAEIQKLHEGFKQRWRAMFQATNKAPVQHPMNIQLWKDQLRNAFTAAKVLVSRLGLYGYLFRDFQSVNKVMQMSAYLVKQLQQPNLIILSQTDLESMTQWLQSQAQMLIHRITTLQVTPELRPF
ncbi:6509_t:CDS:2, partial [Acaulospora colombiana]